jgi:hypothetical protein
MENKTNTDRIPFVKKEAKKKKEAAPLECLEQITLVNILRQSYPLTHSIPNDAKRSPQLAKKMKETGLLSGVPDLFIPELSLYVELKKTKGGALSPAQKAFIEAVNATTPCRAILARGYKDALEQIKNLT